MEKNTISEQLLQMEVAIVNAMSSPEIMEKLEVFGYTEDRMSEGKTLLEKTLELDRKQKEEYGEQYEASALVAEKRERITDVYMKAVKVARIALRENDKAPGALLLNGRRKRDLSGWLEQSTVFYTNLLKDDGFKAEMARFGYTEEKLNGERQLLEEMIQANQEQEKEKGEAQAATNQRDLSLDLLDEWYRDFKEIAIIALEQNPQWREKLGFLERS